MTTIDQAADVISAVKALVKSELAPITDAIDREGFYPRDFMHNLGETGGFSATLPRAHGGNLSKLVVQTQGGNNSTAIQSDNETTCGISTQIDIIREIGRECGSTSFLTWCQSACVTYLVKSPNDTVRNRYLDDIACGRLLTGTGMSNAVKHLAGIENIRLKARREGTDYIVSGSLPWVSNIGDDHLAIVAAEVDDGGYIMFAVRCNADGVSLHACPEFAALEGTQTLNIRLKDTRITSDDVIAHPPEFKAYVQSIKPTFVLTQIGMGFGIIDGSLRTIRESNVVSAHVNEFLDDQHDELATELAALEGNTKKLALQAQRGNVAMIDILRLRLATSELTLRAANSAVLHAGARGYLMRHPAQRRLREAVFVAIVTPALKHLRKEIHVLEQQEKEAQVA